MVIPLGLLNVRLFQWWVESWGVGPCWHSQRTNDFSFLTLGVPLGRICQSKMITTDACGVWKSDDLMCHINSFEMMLNFQALSYFLPDIQDRQCVSSLTHKPSRENAFMPHMEVSMAHSSLGAEQVSVTTQNTFLRLGNRLRPGEWRLHYQTLAQIRQTFRKVEVDRFASSIFRRWSSLISSGLSSEITKTILNARAFSYLCHSDLDPVHCHVFWCGPRYNLGGCYTVAANQAPTDGVALGREKLVLGFM